MNPRLLKTFLNLYPPYLGAGVRVAHIAEDWSAMRVELRLRWYNRNYVGTHYGGNLFTMTDPFYMLMLMHRMGPGFMVWDKDAKITFLKPGKGTVVADMVVSEERLAEIRAATANGAKHLPTFDVQIVDEEGEVVATVHKTLYVRQKELD